MLLQRERHSGQILVSLAFAVNPSAAMAKRLGLSGF